MGIMKTPGRRRPLRPERLPNGCYTLHRGGEIVASTLPSSFSREAMLEVGRVVIEAFQSAQKTGLPLTDLHLKFSGLTITARELRGGALIFLATRHPPAPARPNPARHALQEPR